MLKFNQLFHGGCNGFFAGPLPIGVQTLVIGIWQHQRLVVVTVKPYLAALPQQLQSLGADSLPHSGAKLI